MGANSCLPNNALRKFGDDDGGGKRRPCVKSFAKEKCVFLCQLEMHSAKHLLKSLRVCVWTFMWTCMCACVLAYLQGKGREAVNFGKCHPHTHFSSPLETRRQIGVKSTQVIYPHRDSDYLSLSLYFYPFLCFLISQSL